MKKKSKKSSNYLEQHLLNFLKRNSNKSYNYKQIAASLEIKAASQRQTIIKLLAHLANTNEIKEVSRGKFTFNNTLNKYIGVIDITSRGSAYVSIEDIDEDIYISRESRGNALPQDTVEIYIYKRRRRGRLEGTVDKVVKRHKESFVGVLSLNNKHAFVKPDGIQSGIEFYIPQKKYADAQDGDKVIVHFTDWPSTAKQPFGEITKVLGKPGDHHTEIHAILTQYDLPYEFPKDVEDFVTQMNLSISQQEINKRLDMRDVLTFTIDPKDAKDFDDALSYQILGNGNIQVGIHIADVSHYVNSGSILDQEAYQRATSVYLVDRVVPMLPEVLSNGVCSLNPREDKLTFSAVFELDHNGFVQAQWFGRTVIHSDERMAYEEAQYLIDHTDTNLIPKDCSVTNEDRYIDSSISNAIIKLNALAIEMRSRRMQQGAISFDKVEVKFNLDEQSDPQGVYFKVAKQANQLIEEYMLLANRSVSTYISTNIKIKNFPFVYRIHDEPDQDKLIALNGLINRFGYQIDMRDRKTTSDSINTLLKEIKGTKAQNMIDTLTIRSMSKASYSTDNIGHYGLAFEYYSHFTSPIRRYPDILAHRLLQSFIDKKAPSKHYKQDLEEQCKHCSSRENLAANAERDSIKFMQIRFMQKHQDEVFEGVISGVTEWGIYVEISINKCEGMIRLRDLTDDHYVYYPEEFAIKGRKYKRSYQLGDTVKVQVKNADLIKRHLDFTLIED